LAFGAIGSLLTHIQPPSWMAEAADPGKAARCLPAPAACPSRAVKVPNAIAAGQ
jgi:hypothetical protein